MSRLARLHCGERRIMRKKEKSAQLDAVTVSRRSGLPAVGETVEEE